jgi:hypothetical protein
MSVFITTTNFSVFNERVFVVVIWVFGECRVHQRRLLPIADQSTDKSNSCILPRRHTERIVVHAFITAATMPIWIRVLVEWPVLCTDERSSNSAYTHTN